MAQSEIQVTTTPPLPGTQLVNEVNDALETIATDFSGATDPAADAFAYSLWADTNTGDLKRRNSANSAWVTIGRIYPDLSKNVLQCLSFAIDAGSTTTSATIVNLSASTKTITPRSTNSIIHIFVNFVAQITAGGAGINSIGNFNLLESSVAVLPNPLTVGVASGSGANLQSAAPAFLSASLANSALTSRSFTLGGFKTGGTSSASAVYQTFTIIEVQA